jgi:hypothetical protein
MWGSDNEVRVAATLRRVVLMAFRITCFETGPAFWSDPCMLLTTLLVKRERSFRKLVFTPEVQNPKGQRCGNASQYFGGPFFDDNGKI